MLRTTFLATLLLATPAAAQPVPAHVAACFTPGEDCGAAIVDAIDAARREVLVEAYGFTSRPIVRALERATGRGVAVSVLLDHSDVPRACSRILALAAAGARVWIDHPEGIAHRKVMVIDGRLVIEGSYNFTWSAEHRNVEDVLFLDSDALAAEFIAAWTSRRDVSEPENCQ